MRFTYRARLARDLERWSEQDLISDAKGEAMMAEYDSRVSAYSFSAIVSMLGVICLCFAAMTFVAANWETMPRLFRVVLLLAAMWTSYGLAVFARYKQQDWLAQGGVLLGCGIFGASIMLVAQMYHMQGQASGAVLTWAVGTVVAALALRSAPALVLAIILFALWHAQVVTVDYTDFGKVVNYPFIVAWSVCAAGAWFLKSRVAAHGLTITGLLWLWVTAAILSQIHDELTFATGLFMLTFTAIAALVYLREHRNILAGFDHSLIAYLMLSTGICIAVWLMVMPFGRASPPTFTQLESTSMFPSLIAIASCGGILALAQVRKSAQNYDLAFVALWALLAGALIHTQLRAVPFVNEIYALAFSIWAIRMGARQEISVVTRLGYLLFTGLMLIIYFQTTGTLLGTAGFYLMTGLVLVLGSIVLPRLLRAISASKGAA
ncbi:MAG: DUF2157 domain-containing protein [Pseudomonadota bacterium]